MRCGWRGGRLDRATGRLACCGACWRRAATLAPAAHARRADLRPAEARGRRSSKASGAATTWPKGQPGARPTCVGPARAGQEADRDGRARRLPLSASQAATGAAACGRCRGRPRRKVLAQGRCQSPVRHEAAPRRRQDQAKAEPKPKPKTASERRGRRRRRAAASAAAKAADRASPPRRSAQDAYAPRASQGAPVRSAPVQSCRGFHRPGN